VGLHHAGLAENDRQIVERLFVSQKIQVRCWLFLVNVPAKPKA
jgi:replicative superfamily II helicase